MSSRRPALRLRDILENAERIRAYTRDFDRVVLATDPMVYDATERCLTRISEAATKIGAWAEQHEPD